jgi:L-seryl-tRNA(Ser) seleniumtransferase
VRERALALARALEREGLGFSVEVVDGASAVGGGAAPTLEVETALLAVTHAALRPSALLAGLRAGDPPVLARVADDRLLLDLRTVAPEDDDVVRNALVRAGA